MIHLLGLLSLLGYLTLAYLSASGTPSHVAWGLVVWLALFIPFGCLARSALHARSANQIDGPTLGTSPKPWYAPLLAPATKTILVWAMLFRIALLPAGLPTEDPLTHLRLDLGSEEAGFQTFLLWDNDVWRYLWEGHIVANGRSPYRLSPQDVIDAADGPINTDSEGNSVSTASWAEDLINEGPWLDVLDRTSYSSHRSVYPPLALALFRVSHGLLPGSVFIWKALLTTLEFIGCLLFSLLLARLGRSHALVLLLAWNPLLIKEVAGSGHLDGILVTLLVATLLLHSGRRSTLAIATLTVAVLVKLWPLILAPALLLRSRYRAWWPLPLGLGLAYWPYRSDLHALVLAFRAFSAEWVFNPGPWLLVEQLSLAVGKQGRMIPDLLHLVLTLLVIAITSWHLIRNRTFDKIGFETAFTPTEPVALARDWYLIGLAFLLFSATVMPWYLISVLPMAILLRSWPWLVTTAATLLSYVIYLDGKERGWVLAIEFLIIAVAFWIAETRRRNGSQEASS